mgnify:CR=1 FL=1
MELVDQFAHNLYFEGAGTILTLITLGKFFEARAKGRTSDAIDKLMNLAPKKATLVRDGVESVIPAEEVAKGDILIVKAGESVPVDKQAGDKVIGATINQSGYFKMRADKVGDETALSQIIRLVDEATSSKAPIAKLADKVAGIFVPIASSDPLAKTVLKNSGRLLPTKPNTNIKKGCKKTPLTKNRLDREA